MKREFNITAGVCRVTENKIIPFTSNLLNNFRHISISWKPNEDAAHPYRVSYSQPIKKVKEVSSETGRT